MIDLQFRWGSKYLMLQRFVDNKKAVGYYNLQDGVKKFEFSTSDFILYESLLVILSRVNELSQKLCSANHVTLSLVLPALFKLKLKDLLVTEDDLPQIKQIKDKLACNWLPQALLTIY